MLPLYLLLKARRAAQHSQLVKAVICCSWEIDITIMSRDYYLLWRDISEIYWSLYINMPCLISHEKYCLMTHTPSLLPPASSKYRMQSTSPKTSNASSRCYRTTSRLRPIYTFMLIYCRLDEDYYYGLSILPLNTVVKTGFAKMRSVIPGTNVHYHAYRVLTYRTISDVIAISGWISIYAAEYICRHWYRDIYVALIEASSHIFLTRYLPTNIDFVFDFQDSEFRLPLRDLGILEEDDISMEMTWYFDFEL
jgi:hypothetical protein